MPPVMPHQMPVHPVISSNVLLEGLRAEHQLLVYCARVDVSPALAGEIISLTQGNLDWEYLEKLAISHNVLPLLYRTLQNCCPEQIPAPTLSRLKKKFQQNTWKNLFLTRELIQVLSACLAQGIQAVPIKGPALAVDVYQNLALRQFQDLDILLREADVHKARDLLIKQGYQGQTAIELNSHWEHHMARGDVHLELQWRMPSHWQIMSNRSAFPYDAERVWQNLREVTLADTPVSHLSREDLLLLLCLHGNRHGWERLSWICDVAETARVHADMDWQRLMLYADEIGSQRIVLLGLTLAHILLDAPLPDAIQQKIDAQSVLRALAQQIIHKLFNDPEEETMWLEETAFHLKVRDRLWDRVQILFTPNDKDRDWVSLPSALSPLYYLIRPFRLITEYGLRRGKSSQP
jgi:hypothetical protein